MSESFEERVRGLMSPIGSRWLQMPSERNRERITVRKMHINCGVDGYID